MPSKAEINGRGGRDRISSLSGIDEARQVFRDVLADPDATRTEKLNAAKALADLERKDDQLGSGLFKLTRDDIRAEIARVRAQIDAK